MDEAGGFADVVLRIAGFVVAAFVMYALMESRFDRTKTLAAFGGGMALIAFVNAAGFAVFGFETFAPFYPLTANVPALVLLFAVSRQRPLVNAFTLLTAVQVNAIVVVAGAGALGWFREASDQWRPISRSGRRWPCRSLRCSSGGSAPSTWTPRAP